MSVNLYSLGNEILGWLKLSEKQEDTSGLQREVCQVCCEKPLESKETAIGMLMILSAKLKDAHFLPESEPQLLIAKKISELAQVEHVSRVGDVWGIRRPPVETKRKAEDAIAEPPKVRAKAAEAQEKVAMSQPSTQSEIEEVRHCRQFIAKFSDFVSKVSTFYSKIVGETVACLTEADDFPRKVAYQKELSEKFPALERELHQLEEEEKQFDEDLEHAVWQGKISEEAVKSFRCEMIEKLIAVAFLRNPLFENFSRLVEKSSKS
jgi:hypothetical protein